MNSIQWREQKETRYNDNEECAASDPVAAHEDDARLEKKKDVSGDEVSPAVLQSEFRDHFNSIQKLREIL